MSTTLLDPGVAAKLQQFSRRRFQLLIVRGLCAGVVTFLVCIAIVAFIDWYWLLSEQTRWLLSGSAYAITLTVVWMTCLSRLLRNPAREEIATCVEAAEPELRENLLSALELATDDPDQVTDSPVFRGLLQSKVAQQMARVRISGLLPIRLLRRWLVTAVVVVAVIAGVLSLSDPRYRILAARAVFPGANIERVSRIQVEILQPTQGSAIVARDETVGIIVGISGGDVDEVTLETFSPGESPQQQSMRACTQNEFAANLNVATETVEFRILAGDAVTRKYSITSRPRPRVIAFHKTWRFPEYSGLSPQDVTEDHGDLAALAGTQADLQLELDQEVSQAELRIDPGGSKEIRRIALSRNDSGRWSATVPVDEAAIYKVHLVAKETGFENLFSPRYEIRPLPDLIPRVGFVDQTESSLLLPPGDLLALKGMAEDDLPLVSLAQEISLNGAEWQTIPREFVVAAPAVSPAAAGTPPTTSPASAHRVESTWEWDLQDLLLKTGDQITTRLVATDRKGNRGESVPLQIVIASPDFDPDRHLTMQQKAELYPAFANLEKIAEEQKVAALAMIERLRAEPARAAEEQALDRTSLIDLTRKLRTAAGKLQQQIHEVTRAMPAGADAYDLDLAGRMMSRLQQEHSQTSESLVRAMATTTDPERLRKDLDELKRSYERTADDSKATAFHFQRLVSHNILAAVAMDFDAMLQQQKLVVNSPTQTWSRLVRQETVFVNQLLLTERLLAEYEPHLPDHLRNQFRQMLDWGQQKRDQLQQATESEDKLPELQRLSQNLLRELTERQRVEVLDGGLSEQLNQARREFDQRSGSLSDPLTQLAQAIQEETRLTVQSLEAGDSARAADFTAQAQRFAVEIDVRLRSSIDQLRSRRVLTQSRTDADSIFASDAGLTHRAVVSVLSQHRQVSPKDSQVAAILREIAPAYRILEAGHEMKNLQSCLSGLLQSERWGSQDLTSRIDHPRQWDVVQKGLETAVNKLRAAGVKNELMSKIDEVRWSPPLQEANRKISQRRWVRENFLAAGSDLMQLRDLIEPLEQELQPIMADARAVIAKYAPTIPQMAEQAAVQVRQLEEQTTKLADQNDTAPPPTNPQEVAEDAPQLADLTQQQQHINQQIDDLFEALVEDANKQDVFQDDQRERARDADDSIAMVQEPARRMNDALKRAERNSDTKEQAKELAQAAEQQERTAQALETVAKHFDNLEKNLDVAETRAELRQFERDQGIAGEMDQQQNNLEQLADAALQNPLDLIKELEAELQRNPAMQQALSEISQKTLQEARNALQDAAARDQEIQRANERSDSAFQEKKKALAENLRELGREAATLSQQLVAQANSASSQAKTPEAQLKFAETQQKLNEAANTANSANEGELQADLARKTRETKDLLLAAAETLKVGKEHSEAAKTAEIHADDKARQNVQKDLENRRQRFNDQRKKDADGAKQRADNAERQADQQVKAAENSRNQTDRQLQQAQKNLEKKPEDNNLKRAVAQAENAQKTAQQKVDQTRNQQELASQKTAQALANREALNQLPQAPLADKNPAAQLAEEFAAQAQQAAEELNRRAEQLAQRTDFGREVTPSKAQLGYAATQQKQVATDVDQTADDLARAARHERRLSKEIAAAALQQASTNVDKVADTEAAQATTQLETARDAAADPQSPDGQPKPDNGPSLAANSAVAQSEAAIRNQADALTGILTPLLEAQAAAAASAASGAEAAGQPQPDAGSDTPSGASQQQTPEQMAAGRQLAQTLDELDRLPPNAQSAAADPQSALQAAMAQRPGLSQAALAQQARLAAARALAQQQAALSANPTGFAPEGTPAYEGQTGAFALQSVNRIEGSDWGKLREQVSEEQSRGRREVVSDEYRRSVEAYFRVLAERAQQKK